MAERTPCLRRCSTISTTSPNQRGTAGLDSRAAWMVTDVWVIFLMESRFTPAMRTHSRLSHRRFLCPSHALPVYSAFSVFFPPILGTTSYRSVFPLLSVY